jgi:hypothetical protein
MWALPSVGQLDGGLPLSPQGLRGHEALQIKRLFPCEHVIHGPRQLMGEHGQRCGFAGFAFQFGKVRLAGPVLPSEEDRGFGKGPAQMDIADLPARRAQPFVVRLLGAFDQPAVGDEILHPRKAGDVVDFIEEDQGENLANPRHRLQAGKRLDIVGFGRARDIEFDLAQELIVVLDEGDIHFDGLAHAGIREVVGYAFSVGVVRQLLADLRQIVLTVRILNVGHEFGAFAHQTTPAAE